MEASEILLTILWIVLWIGLFIGWIWIIRKYIYRTGNFTCKKCHKNYPQGRETEKNLCEWCKEQRERERERERQKKKKNN